MMDSPQPNPSILKLDPYKPGMPISQLARLYKLHPEQIIKLASNENPNGPSEKVLEAIEQAAQDITRYPDGTELRHTLATKHNLDEKNILLGNGSNDILDLIARVFLNQDSEALCSEYSFIIFRLISHLAGATNVVAPANKYGHDLRSILGAITKRTRVIWLANPNNPTGTFVEYKDVYRFLKEIPNDIVVVLDEAYYEYLSPEHRIDSTEWLSEFRNLILVRTFSKIHGLAGLRVGYGMASTTIVELLNRARQAFNVNSLGLEGALAAVGDKGYTEQGYQDNLKGVAQLQQGFERLKILYIPSFGNFITIIVNDAPKLFDQLLAKGIIVRPLQEYGLHKHLRVSVGTDGQNKQILKALEDFLNV